MKPLFAFLSRHPWIYLVLTFVILVAVSSSIIYFALKYGPEEMELKHESTEY